MRSAPSSSDGSPSRTASSTPIGSAIRRRNANRSASALEPSIQCASSTSDSSGPPRRRRRAGSRVAAPTAKRSCAAPAVGPVRPRAPRAGERPAGRGGRRADGEARRGRRTECAPLTGCLEPGARGAGRGGRRADRGRAAPTCRCRRRRPPPARRCGRIGRVEQAGEACPAPGRDPPPARASVRVGPRCEPATPGRQLRWAPLKRWGRGLRTFAP